MLCENVWQIPIFSNSVFLIVINIIVIIIIIINSADEVPYVS